MRTEQIQVYKFKELKPKIKEKVLENLREINTDYDWFEFLFEDFNLDLKEIGLSCESFSFDLYHNEISFNNISIEDSEKFLNSFLNKDDKIFNSLKTIEVDEDFYYSFSINENGRFIIEDFDNNKMSLKEIEELEDKGTEFLKDKLKVFLNKLKEQYEYLLSDEAVKDTINSNEYEFIENGTIY